MTLVVFPPLPPNFPFPQTGKRGNSNNRPNKVLTQPEAELLRSEARIQLEENTAS
jgi:hypothetical protein